MQARSPPRSTSLATSRRHSGNLSTFLTTNGLLNFVVSCRNYYSGTGPNDQLPISSNIDNKALHEVSQKAICIWILNSSVVKLYLWGFAEAVRAGTGYVMWYAVSRECTCESTSDELTSNSSYNVVNQTHACSSAYTQNNILKGEVSPPVRQCLSASDMITCARSSTSRAVSCPTGYVPYYAQYSIHH